MSAFDVSKGDIERLDQFRLTELMKKILRTELSKLELKQTGLSLSLDINDPDGGLDSFLNNEVPADHPWLPVGKSGWQFKSGDNFPKEKIEKHVLTDDGKYVKPRIKKLLERNETYALVVSGKDFAPNALESKEAELIEAFNKRGYPESKVKIFSSGMVADWVNELPSVIAYLKPERIHFKDINEWYTRIEAAKTPKQFVLDEKREKLAQSIPKIIVSNYNKEQATIIRLVGHSGVGKTRLIYEILNGAKELRDLVLYIETPDKLPLPRFNVIAKDRPAIIVIDDCDHEKHALLAKEVEGIGGQFTLITLDFDIDKPLPRDMHYILDPLDKDASNKLIQLMVHDLPEIAKARITEFSEGYPILLVSLAKNFSYLTDMLSPSNLSKLRMDILFDRIISGRLEKGTESRKIQNVLTMLSIFKRLGWDDEVSNQGRKVCDILKIDWSEARSIVKEQETRKLVMKSGRYRYTTPMPLSIYLSSNWLDGIDKVTLINFYSQLPDSESKRAFLDRLSDLGFSKQAKEVLGDFFLAFEYEQLNSAIGSDILLSMARADHSSAMETLERILSPLSKEKLLEFREGRRGVINALERIAWWEDTFYAAANLLLKLADAENETWSNNATGIFVQLFQTYLGGTTVPVWKRHDVLEKALNSNKKSLQKLALKGLDSSLNLLYATRSSSGEEQGGIIPPPEWNPKSLEDLKTSVSSAFRILSPAMQMKDTDISKEAVKVFLSKVRVLLSQGFKDIVMERLQYVESRFPELDQEVIKVVERVIFYDSNKLPKEVTNEILDFRDKFIGIDFKGRMKRYVKSRPLEDSLKENRDKVEYIIRTLAEESIISPDKLKTELSWLVTKEAENGYIFGRFIGELDNDYQWLDTILSSTKNSKDPSVIFLGGYLSSVKIRNEKVWEEILEKCYNDKVLKKFLLEIIWRSGANDVAVKLIVSMLKKQEIKPQEINLLTYGAWFRNVSSKEFKEFLEEFYKIEDGKYTPIILGIIDQYIEGHPDIIDETKDILLKYLTRPEIFSNSEIMTAFYWDKLSNLLMGAFHESIVKFSDALFNALAKETFYRDYESYFQKQLEYFLKQDFENTWVKLKKYLLLADFRAFQLRNILKGGFATINKEKNSLLDLIPEKCLLSWTEENPDKAPYILAEMIPLHEYEPSLHPLARILLIKYPNDENLASELSANWNTEGFSGPASEHYKNKLRIAENWATDAEPSISNWAKKEVNYLRSKIERVKRVEEEDL